MDGKLSRAAFISIAILTFITFVGNFTQLQLSSALPIIVSEFHISVTTGQWLTSVFQLVMGVMVPLTAFLTRRFSTRQIVICSMAVFTVGSLMAWVGPSFIWVLRTLSRIGEESSERAVVLVTHRLEEIPAGFDHIAIMGRKPIPAEDATEAGVDSMGNPGAGTIVYTGSLEDGLTDERLSDLFGMPIEVQHTHGRWAAYAV